jgi:hypothetical protein
VEGQKVVFENDQCLIFNNGELHLQTDTSPIANYITNKPIRNKLAATLLPKGFEVTCTVTSSHQTAFKAASPETWHTRLGHLSSQNMVLLYKKDLVKDFPLKVLEIESVAEIFCEPCVKANAKKFPSPQSTNSPSTSVLQLLHTDLAGPIIVDSKDGKRYILTLLDDYAKMSWNMSPHSNIHDNATPYGLWRKTTPTIGHLRLFGFDASAVVPEHKRDKFSPKDELGTFVGYDQYSGAYKIYYSNTNTVKVFRDVVSMTPHLQSSIRNLSLLQDSIDNFITNRAANRKVHSLKKAKKMHQLKQYLVIPRLPILKVNLNTSLIIYAYRILHKTIMFQWNLLYRMKRNT